MNISEWSEKIAGEFELAAKQFSNEMELREHVHHHVLSALQDLYDLGVSATAGEMNTKRTGSRSPLDRLYGGVAVEWEWSMKPARREHGAQQALNYLENIRENHPSVGAYTAVVSDGNQWGFLKVDPAEEQDLFSAPIPEKAADYFVWVANSPGAVRQFLELVGSHKKSPVTSKSLALKFGPSSGVASRLVTVLGQSMAGRQSADRTDTLYIEWRRALDVVYGDLDLNDSQLAVDVQTAYGTPIARPLGELLFVLHTYFAFVGRVIAVELLAVATGEHTEAPSNWRGLSNEQLLFELRQLEAGRLPGDLEIANLFEADLFSWWTDRAENNSDLLDVIRDVLKEVSELAFPKIAFGPQQGGDVLRDLYQALIPNTLRKALGEFLTPYWLAEASLQRVREVGGDLADGRVLDPTCGTGTFIVPVLTERLNRLIRMKGSAATTEDVQAVLDKVAGIDLNPVAVTATRVNYVIALGELASVGKLTLPVWRADSLILPEASPLQAEIMDLAGIRHFRLRTSLPAAFAVPASMTSATRVAVLRSLIEGSLLPFAEVAYQEAEITGARERFAESFETEFGANGLHAVNAEQFSFEDELKVALYLFDQVTVLSLEGRNGVWARLIENAYAPLFAGRFDVIVGNPPWLTWPKLPAGWRGQSEALWRRCGLWYTPEEAGDSFSFQSADIATLVFAIAIERYAADDAVIGLLTPAALMNADPGGRAFRKFRLRPDKRDKAEFPGVDVKFRALWLDDWSAVTPFAPDAANKPIFLIVKKGEEQLSQTPGAVWRRTPKVRAKGSNWRDKRAALRESRGSFAPIDPNTPTSAWRFQDASLPALLLGGSNDYTFGTGLHTRGANGVYFVDISSPKPAIGAKKATVQIENRPSEGKIKVGKVKGRVEAELVYPLLRGKDVQHWTAVPATYFVLPHDTAALDKPLSSAKFKEDFPGAFTWFSRQRSFLQARKTPPARGWNMSLGGEDWCRVDGALQYMQADHLVVVRELSSRPGAALVEPRTDFDLGGRKVSPLIDHKLMLRSVGSREEALYLVAMINSTPLQDLLESFVSSTSVSPTSMKRLPIPTFDTGSAETVALVGLASKVQASVDRVAKAGELQEQMDALVLKIVAAQADYQPQPKRAKRRPGKRRVVDAPAVPKLF